MTTYYLKHVAAYPYTIVKLVVLVVTDNYSDTVYLKRSQS